MPDFTQYVPPGVYLEFDEPVQSVPVGILPGRVAIIGPSVGYRTHSEVVALNGTAAVELAQKGIDVSSVSVTGGDGTVYTVDTDFVLTVDAGEDGNIGNTEDNVTTIARIDVGTGGTIPDGATVFLSYRYTDENYTAPAEFSDFDDVQEQFGPPMDLETGEITSPLSLAARFAFENGARDLLLVTTPTPSTATRAEINSAYTKILTRADISIVVPLSVGVTEVASGEPEDVASVGNDLANHCDNAAEDRLHRVGILGYDHTVTAQPHTLAQEIDSQRVVLAWPNRMEFYNAAIRRTQDIGGYYLAAAYAGRLAGQPVQMPLTRKYMRGFAGIPRVIQQGLTKTLKNTYSANGVAVTELDRNKRLVVRHGVTTSTGGLHRRELNLVRARDAMEIVIEQTIEGTQLIGSTIDNETPAVVKGVVQGALERCTTSGIIVAYQALRVRQSTLNPTIIEVMFAYQPAYPLNYITVVYSISVATGEVTESFTAV